MAYKARKRKVKKNIPEGQAHIHSTFNNTIVTITDKEGNTIQSDKPKRMTEKYNFKDLLNDPI